MMINRIFCVMFIALIQVGVFNISLNGQDFTLKKDTILNYTTEKGLIVIKTDSIKPFDYSVHRRFLDDNTFIESFEGIVSSDTFRIENGTWYKKTEGIYKDFFSKQWFETKKTRSFCNRINVEQFPITDSLFCTIYSPLSQRSKNLFIMSMYDQFLRKEIIIWFDPTIGIVKKIYGQSSIFKLVGYSER